MKKGMKIYTMGGSDMKWRSQIRDKIDALTFNNLPTYIHPPLYRNHIRVNEFDIWNANQIYDSDIIIVNTMEIKAREQFELGIVNAINMFSDKYIYVVGVGEWDQSIPYHIESMIYHYEEDYEDAANYISNILLK